jgi:hypothetical protein
MVKLMFFVSDTQAKRHKMIRSFLKGDRHSIAVILAAVDFEWTVRRAILSLGSLPTTEIRASLESYRRFEDYKDFWNSHVKPRLNVTLVQVVGDWSNVRKAFDSRNRLVHGITGAIKRGDAENRTHAALNASQDLEAFCEKNGGSVYQRIDRRKPREVAK